jgi:hypothetical protein
MENRLPRSRNIFREIDPFLAIVGEFQGGDRCRDPPVETAHLVDPHRAHCSKTRIAMMRRLMSFERLRR